MHTEPARPALPPRDPATDVGGNHYWRYHRLFDLLACKQPVTASTDEDLFIAVHQICELSFHQIILDLDRSLDALATLILDGSGGDEACYFLDRVIALYETVNRTVAILGGMRAFAEFRQSLGPSSGFQSFQWAVTYPDFVQGVVPTVTAPRMRDGTAEAVTQLQRRLASDPNWNDGWYYENGGIARTLEELRFETLVGYGQREILAPTIPDPAARDAAIRAMAKTWAQTYDGHSMVALRKAIGHFDITGEYDKVKAKVLYVIAPNDKLFPGTMCPAYAQAMRSAGIDITYCELVTDKGHLASHADARQWAPMLEAFLARL